MVPAQAAHQCFESNFFILIIVNVTSSLTSTVNDKTQWDADLVTFDAHYHLAQAMCDIK